MNKQLTPELKSLKQDFDFIHKKVGELQWKIAIMHYGRIAVPIQEKELLHDELEHWINDMRVLLKAINAEVVAINKANRPKVRK